MACADALHVRTTDGTWIVGGAAVVFIYDTLGYSALTWPLKTAPLSWVREPGYRLAANHRMWLSRMVFRNNETES